MKTPLDITKLIQETETMFHDGNIEFTERAERTIQTAKADNGDTYVLKIVMELQEAKDYNENYIKN